MSVLLSNSNSPLYLPGCRGIIITAAGSGCVLCGQPFALVGVGVGCFLLHFFLASVDFPNFRQPFPFALLGDSLHHGIVLLVTFTCGNVKPFLMLLGKTLEFFNKYIDYFVLLIYLVFTHGSPPSLSHA